MNEYRLSLKADNDIDDIADYTLEIWGDTQTKVYVAELLQCFQFLADKPDLGRSAAEYGPLLYRYNYKANTVFYELIDKGIFIVRILGRRQDFERYL